ncbi:MAG: hypothetical protein DWQ05_02310 [Calditrichaeota bacterium]|nr:MAG: hypothetical protein DWQ05_02310 [Calditrichota bacterium]
MNEMKTCTTCHKVLPEDPLINFCPYCGVHFSEEKKSADAGINIVIEDQPEEPVEPDIENEPEEPVHAQPETASGGIPWEDGENQSIIERLTHTWSESIFRPTDFFQRMKIVSKLGPALLYGFIFKFFGQVLGNYWAQKQINSMSEQMEQMPAFLQMFYERYMESVSQMGATEQLLLTPFMVIFSLLIVPVIFHASLSLFGVAKNGFATTFRVNAYAEGAAIFQAIPFIGGLVYFVVWLIVVIIGWRECHNTTTNRVVLGLVIPFLACCTFVFMFISLIGNLISV